MNTLNEEQRRRTELNRQQALGKKRVAKLSNNDGGVQLHCNMQESLTEEQRVLIEKNRRRALEKKRQRIQPQQILPGPIIKEEPTPQTVITSEQRARMENNRQKALEKKRQRATQSNASIASSPTNEHHSSATISPVSAMSNDKPNVIVTPPSPKRRKTELHNNAPNHQKKYDTIKRVILNPHLRECEHCHHPISRHKACKVFRGGPKRIMCKFFGQYKCGCGRKWGGKAMKIQNRMPEDDTAFPSFLFSNCKKCKDNGSVVLLEYKPGIQA